MYKNKINKHNINGENMNNIDIRKYIIANFKDNTEEEIKSAIEDSISSHEEDPLIGLGVLFELQWNMSNIEEKNKIVTNIKKGM